MTDTDQHGDDGTAPDIRNVTLTDGGDGTVAAEIDLAAEIPDNGSYVAFLIDAGRSGSSDGVDYLVLLNASGGVLVKWDGANFVPFDHHAISPSMVGGRLTFTLTLADIGGAQEFDFAAGTQRDFARTGAKFQPWASG